MEIFKIEDEVKDEKSHDIIFVSGSGENRGTTNENMPPTYTILKNDHNYKLEVNSVKQEDGEDQHSWRNIETIFLPNPHEGVEVETPFFDYNYYKEVCGKRTKYCEIRPKPNITPVINSNLCTGNNVYQQTTSQMNNQNIYNPQSLPATFSQLYAVNINNVVPEVDNIHVNFNFFQQVPQGSYIKSAHSEGYVLQNNNVPLYNTVEGSNSINSIYNNRFISVKPDIALKELIDVNKNKSGVRYKTRGNKQIDPLGYQRITRNLSLENENFLGKTAKKTKSNNRLIINGRPEIGCKEIINVSKNKTNVTDKIDSNIQMDPLDLKNTSISSETENTTYSNTTSSKESSKTRSGHLEQCLTNTTHATDKKCASIDLTCEKANENLSSSDKLEESVKEKVSVCNEENPPEKYKCPVCKRPREFFTLLAVNNHLKFDHISLLPKTRHKVEDMLRK